MVHVLSEVLRKVGKSLRRDGNLLIIQPSQENPIVEVEIDGNIAFREETNEKYFRGYLSATVEAIHQSVREGLFVIESEIITPDGNSYHCNEYDSLREWVEDRRSFCEDLEALNALSERIQKLIQGREHSVYEYWREYTVLFRRLG